MKTILKLWRGGLSEEELFDSSIKKKIDKTVKDEKVIEEANQFYESLSEKQRKLLTPYWMVESTKWSMEVDWAFVTGFRTGALLMMDILKED